MTALVLVHGFMGGAAQWDDQKQALSGAMDVVTVDLPGFGENADLDAPGSIEAFAAWVLDTLRAQRIERFHLLGHSMGGMIAQQMTAMAPQRVERLVLYGTGATGALPGRFEPIETSKRRAQQEGARATARRIAATWFLGGTQAPAFERCAAIAERSSLQAIHAGLDAMQAWDGQVQLADIAAPTLLIWGDHDRTYPWAQTERLWRGISGARLAVMPDCAHAAHMEKPALFEPLLRDFLIGAPVPAQ